jgi:hypothetical protein
MRRNRPARRMRRGPVAAGRAVQYVAQAPPGVASTLSDAELEAYLELVDAEMEESEALDEGEIFGGSKWKKKHASAKKRRKKAEDKLKAYKEKRAAKKTEREAQAAEAKLKKAEEAEQSEAAEPAPGPSMEDEPPESSAEPVTKRPTAGPTAGPAEDPNETAELEALMDQAAREDEEDRDEFGRPLGPYEPPETIEPTYRSDAQEQARELAKMQQSLEALMAQAARKVYQDEDELGILVQETSSMLRPPDILDVFARRLASSLPPHHQHVPMQHGGLSEPGDHQHLVTPRGIHKTYAPDLETHLSETDELVDQIRESFSRSRW